ncbi:MAG: hypothetical protein VX733_09645 [Candidatus Latescibacterota bacterium]|nr:hypothetical protein [Candidatus Latescibacterota bacterium]
MDEGRQSVDELVARLHAGTLTEQGLRAAFAEAVKSNSGCQELLILEASDSSPASTINAFSHFKDGEPQVVADDPEQWPYQTPLAAVKDGWRITTFPEMALQIVAEEEWHGVGFRFVLERTSP